jgi:hypothetical protein
MSNVSIFSASKVPAFARNNELSATARALTGGGGAAGATGKRISIKGGVFRLIDGGKEIAAIDERHLDVVIIKAAPEVSRQYYAAAYNADTVSAPDCTSNDGKTPDASSKNKQAETCMACAQNQAGSGQGNRRACRYLQRMAVVLANDMEGSVMQLTLPATSIFGKEQGDKRALQAYARYLAAQNPPVNPEQIVTRMKFDTTSEAPKLLFAATRWLTDDEYDTVQTQAETDDAKKAIAASSASAPAAAPLQLAGAKPMGQLMNEEHAAAYEPIAAKAAKAAKAKPAPVVVEEDEEDTAPEPEVRKATAKPSAVPASKGKLADIVSAWDDEE